MKKKIFFLSTILVLILLVGTTVFASEYVQFKPKTCTFAAVPDTKVGAKTATALGGIVLNGKNAYAVKTDEANTMCVLYVFNNYKKKAYKTYQLKGDTHHANGLAFYNNSLYLATMNKNNEVIKYSTTGKLLHKYKCDFNPTAIAHYKGNQFIMRTKKGAGLKTLKFAIGHFEKGTGGIGKFVSEKTFTVNNPKASEGYNVGQDIGYNNTDLCIPLMKVINGRFNHNVILYIRLNVNDPIKKIYNPWRIAVINKKNNVFGQYEIESLDFGPNNELIMGCKIWNSQGGASFQGILE